MEIENAITLLKDNGYEVIKLPDNIKEYADTFFKLVKSLKCTVKSANIKYYEEEPYKPYLFNLKVWFPVYE